MLMFFFSSRRRHTICALVTGVQTCALPICLAGPATDRTASVLPQELIRTKRDGGRLPADAVAEFVAGMTDGSIGEGQAAAFAMAVFFRGLDMAERIALTRAMMQSGTVLDWTRERLGGPVVDKPSPGGVGDKVSLMLGPLAA